MTKFELHVILAAGREELLPLVELWRAKWWNDNKNQVEWKKRVYAFKDKWSIDRDDQIMRQASEFYEANPL